MVARTVVVMSYEFQSFMAVLYIHLYAKVAAMVSRPVDYGGTPA